MKNIQKKKSIKSRIIKRGKKLTKKKLNKKKLTKKKNIKSSLKRKHISKEKN